jgi:diphosphomevalonate decarboxylase
MGRERSATAVAGPSIALTKYWGNADDELRIPVNDSIALTLDRACTVTTVSFQPDLDQDQVEVDGQLLYGSSLERLVCHLDLFRDLAGISWRGRVVSQNNFPAGAGIASSSSGFAALTLACVAALGLDLTRRDLSRLARRGSASAARSIFGGFVLLRAGATDEETFAEPLYDPDWWEVCDLVVILSRDVKRISSSAGHRLAETSPFHAARVARVAALDERLRRALAERDFAALGEVVEQDALMMHAVMMTSQPTLLYWLPETVAMMHRVYRWREEGLPVYFTIDAGPNVHVLTLPEHVASLLAALRADATVQEVLVCRPGAGARLAGDYSGA